jgi:hypothetical protein
LRHERKLLGMIAVVACLASATLVHAYTYIGTNYVNDSGAHCRTTTSAQADALTYNPESVKVNSGHTTRRLFCPMQRRENSVYGAVGGLNSEFKVDTGEIWIRAEDQNTGRTLSCFSFAAAIGSGANYFGATRYLCSTSTGCGSVANSYTGRNNVVLYSPYAGSPLTVNWGYACDVPGNSLLYYTDVGVNPNP